jgi:hypothetical protein
MAPPERVQPLVRVLGEIKQALHNLVETITEYQQSQAGEKEPKAETESKVAVRLPLEVTKYYGAEYTDRPVKESRDRIRLGLEIVGIIVALAIAVLTICSLRILNGQLEQVKLQTEVSERPWISVKAAPESDLMFVGGVQPVLSIRVSLRNVGKSIAKNIAVNARLFASDPTSLVGDDAGVNQEKVCNSLDDKTSFDLFPSDEPSEQILSISAAPLKGDSPELSLAGDSARKFVGFYIVGCVRYHYSFGDQVRESRFAGHLIGPPTWLKDNAPVRLSNGKGMFAGFEVGVTVPRTAITVFREMNAASDAN